ncbi:IS66 family transposase [Martelella lutilitoris]|uniref:IS66 family transposase n=1 Tax=Martelella lutilitoris TaxID=2583532 RepID=UPI001FEDDE54|nr:IS66 family transposase [Martelella lutilitoris]
MDPAATIALIGERRDPSINNSRIEIDSNTVERSIRPIALNRKSACSQARAPRSNPGRPSPRLSKRPSSMRLSHFPICPPPSTRSSVAI